MKNFDDEGYYPPLESTASLRPAARSQASVRGFLTIRCRGEGRPQKVYYHSLMEKKALLLIRSRADVVKVEDQPERVLYINSDGRQAYTIFDWRFTLRNGEVIAVAVKPEREVQRQRFRETLALVGRQMSNRFADRIELFTEQHIHPIELQNAEMLHFFRNRLDAEADTQLAKSLTALSGAMQIQSIIDASGLGSRGFGACVRAIYAGGLEADRNQRITPQTLVRVVEGVC